MKGDGEDDDDDDEEEEEKEEGREEHAMYLRKRDCRGKCDDRGEGGERLRRGGWKSGYGSSRRNKTRRWRNRRLLSDRNSESLRHYKQGQ